MLFSNPRLVCSSGLALTFILCSVPLEATFFVSNCERDSLLGLEVGQRGPVRQVNKPPLGWQAGEVVSLGVVRLLYEDATVQGAGVRDRGGEAGQGPRKGVRAVVTSTEQT